MDKATPRRPSYVRKEVVYGPGFNFSGTVISQSPEGLVVGGNWPGGGTKRFVPWSSVLWVEL